MSCKHSFTLIECSEVKILWPIGPVASRRNQFNCYKTCGRRDFLCEMDIQNINSSVLFQEAGVNCSTDDSQKDWSDPYHPVVFPENNLCVGYENISSQLDCHPVNHTTDAVNGSRRICNCKDPSEFWFSS